MSLERQYATSYNQYQTMPNLVPFSCSTSVTDGRTTTTGDNRNISSTVKKGKGR